MNSVETATLELGRALRVRGYRFVTPTPETLRRVNARPGNAVARTLRDVFGYSRPFAPSALPADLLALLRAAEAVTDHDGLLASTVRFSTIGDALFVHSAYPTLGHDAVFFGPDTYRFCALLEREVVRARRVVDVGCGSGAGGLTLASRADHVVLADVNAAALSHARVNAALAGAAHVEVASSDVLAGVHGAFDLVVANPPYMVDEAERVYRDGGGALGEALSVRIAREALERLSPGGRLVLYTGAAIVDGEDVFRREVTPVLTELGARFAYAEIDPDVFGEELEREAYASVDRIAAVSLCATRP